MFSLLSSQGFSIMKYSVDNRGYVEIKIGADMTAILLFD
jgi:hypothetical protein